MLSFLRTKIKVEFVFWLLMVVEREAITCKHIIYIYGNRGQSTLLLINRLSHSIIYDPNDDRHAHNIRLLFYRGVNGTRDESVACHVHKRVP